MGVRSAPRTQEEVNQTMPDWKYVDWSALQERFLIGIIWWPTMFSLVCDIVIGLLVLQYSLAVDADSPQPHPQYRKRWTELYYGKNSRRGIR